MMHEPDGGNTFAGVVIIKPFIFSLPPPPPPHPLPCERNTKALCPKCNALISLKLFIGICGASAAGLSPFQLPALFNSAGNEKCSELRQRRRACAPLSPASASLSFSPSNHRSRGKRVGKDFLCNYVEGRWRKKLFTVIQIFFFFKKRGNFALNKILPLTADHRRH